VKFHTKPLLILFPVAALLSAACSPNMREQPRYKPLAYSGFFADARAARQPVDGTVARGQLRQDAQFYTGKVNGAPVQKTPVPVTAELLKRGQERYDIYCSPCHGRVGDGQGMVVQRGFQPPPSYHVERLVESPDGHFFDVITNGFGVMASYASRVAPADRWAITAYIRALQLSQAATMSDVPAGERDKLMKNIK
jgi:mono/diheme cytochrome c family protein